MTLTHLLDSRARVPVNKDELREQAGIIESVFLQFGIPATVKRIDSGPTLSRFSILPGDTKRKRPKTDVEHEAVEILKGLGYGTKQKPITRDALNHQLSRIDQYETKRIRLRDIVALEDDLALYLDRYGVRIVSQLTDSGMVGVEFPHTVRGTVSLREIMESKEWAGALPVPFGREAGGIPVVRDLEAMPHLLVAGATGTGKSVFLHSLLTSLIATNSVGDLRIAIIDMKEVELSRYTATPHSMAQAATNAEEAHSLLDKLIVEMERRYELFAVSKVRNITGYRQIKRLPRIVLVVDELADLMEQDKKGTEKRILRLSQKSRAAGIHIVLATQSPRVDIVTGTIRANIPVKLALTVTSQTDSVVILKEKGAEKLLSKGDALLQIPGEPLIRVQTPYVGDDEIERVISATKG